MSVSGGNLEELPTTELLRIYCVRRDRSAMGELYKRIRRFLLPFIRGKIAGRLKSRLDAEDVLQDVFVNDLRGLKRFGDRGRVYAWFRKVAANRIKDLARKKSFRQERTTSFEHTGKQLRDGALTPCSAACVRDEMRVILDTMKRFPPKDRKIFILRYFKKKGFKEIQNRVDMKYQTVFDHYRRMCRIICKRLGGGGEHGPDGGSPPPPE